MNIKLEIIWPIWLQTMKSRSSKRMQETKAKSISSRAKAKATYRIRRTSGTWSSEWTIWSKRESRQCGTKLTTRTTASWKASARLSYHLSRSEIRSGVCSPKLSWTTGWRPDRQSTPNEVSPAMRREIATQLNRSAERRMIKLAWIQSKRSQRGLHSTRLRRRLRRTQYSKRVMWSSHPEIRSPKHGTIWWARWAQN